MGNQSEKAAAFKALHETGETFIIPNPWDAGSAQLLEQAGFSALATTSSGFARTLGRDDGQVSLDEKLDHCRLLASVTEIPITADFENGFADKAEDVAENVLALAAAGLVGGSIEDWSGSKIYDFDFAVERVQAAAEAVATLPFPFMLTARTENLLHGVSDMDDTIRRLQAFEAAGADVLFAPGLRDIENVGIVISAVSKPVNVLAPFLPEVTFQEYQEAGVARISVGASLSRYAMQATKEAAAAMRDQGSFSWN